MGILELIISFCSGIVTPLIPIYLKHRQDKRQQARKDVVVSHLEIQQRNQEVLDEIRSELNASRVSIVKFSNGTDFLDNTHILNLTMVGESNSNGFDNMKQDIQRIPAYLFDRVLGLLKVSDYYVENNSDPSLPNNDTVVNIRRSYNLETVIGVKLYDKKGKWKGILLVGFNRNRAISNDEVGFAIIKSKQLQ